jgi:hypothetical protein
MDLYHTFTLIPEAIPSLDIAQSTGLRTNASSINEVLPA